MTDARATQGRGYVGVRDDSAATRVTQGRGYVGVALAPPSRVTQARGYIGTTRNDGENETRVTQAKGYIGLGLHRPPCLTTEAQCWRIERRDGLVLRFTAHDRAVLFAGETYSPCASLTSSALQTSSEFGTSGNMDLAGVIASGRITLGDLWAGRYEGAEVRVYAVDWTDPTRYRILAGGNCGSVQAGTNTFKIEVTTPSERLQQRPILSPVMPTCRFKLGDSRCAIDLEALRVTGSVTALPAPNLHTGALRRAFTDSTRGEAADRFTLGRITWTGGDNVGLSMDVKTFAAGGAFILEQQLQYNIEIGDTYSVVPGCDLLHETCVDEFANGVNFGGFPHLRGTDDLQQTPEVKE